MYLLNAMITKFYFTKEEIRHYLTKSRFIPIRKVWIYILKNMPPAIHKEIKTKPTNLFLVDYRRKLYQFICPDGSKDLKEYLDSYFIFEINNGQNSDSVTRNRQNF